MSISTQARAAFDAWFPQTGLPAQEFTEHLPTFLAGFTAAYEQQQRAKLTPKTPRKVKPSHA